MRAHAAAASVTGVLTKKTHSQPSESVSTPPSSTPAAPPAPATAPQTPSALLRSLPSGNVVVMIDNAAGESSAPPRPWTARAAISMPSEFARPPTSDAAPNSTSPPMNTRLRPSRSAMRPPSSRKPPKTSTYAFTTHWRFDSLKCRSLPIDGSATFTIDASRTTTNCAAASRRSARPRCCWTGAVTPPDGTSGPRERFSNPALSSLRASLQAVRAADHVEHDLVGAGADPVEPHVAPDPLDAVLLHVAGAAVDLNALVRDLHGDPRGVQLRHRDLAHRILAVRETPGRGVDQLARGLDLRGHVGELVPDHLEVADLAPERLALVGVLEGHVERPLC